MCDLLMSEYYWIHWHSASLHPRWQLVVIVALPTSHLRLPTAIININLIKYISKYLQTGQLIFPLFPSERSGGDHAVSPGGFRRKVNFWLSLVRIYSGQHLSALVKIKLKVFKKAPRHETPLTLINRLCLHFCRDEHYIWILP